MPGQELDVFAYLDYRTLLSDYYELKKTEGRGFSYRAFSLRAGLRSPNHLKRVINGERNLTPEMAVRYAKAMGLKGDRARYFTDLVQFAQAKGSAERNAAYTRLTSFRGYRRAQRLDLAHAAYHSEWYIPAVRELVRWPDFQPDPAWIAERIRPNISPANARRALEVLFELELVQRQTDGTVAQTDNIVSTGAETGGLHIANYHRSMLHRAAEAMDAFPASARDLSAVTLSVDQNGLRKIKERLAELRRELLALEASSEDACQVVHVGIQAFPLSTRRRETP